jgi:putative transposase
VRVIKAVKQSYQPSPETLALLEDFRLMVNDCIRIALKKEAEGNVITSMRRLCLASYHALAPYHIATCYRLTAISKAAGILKTYRKALRKNHATRRPYARRLMLTDCYSFRIQGTRLRLTLGGHEYTCIELTPHTLATIQAHTARSITLTATSLSIAYSKEIDEMQPSGVLGIDRNLDNVTVAYSDDGTTRRFDLSEATQIKQTYRFVRSHFVRNDARIRAAVYAKYGKLQRDRVEWILHNASSSVVKEAEERRLASDGRPQGHSQTLSQRQRSRQRLQGKTQLLELLRAPEANRI